MALLLGAGIGLVGIEPIHLLYISSIAGGLGTPLTLGLMLWVARDRQVMASKPIDWRLAGAGWVALAIVTSASALYLWQTLVGKIFGASA